MDYFNLISNNPTLFTIVMIWTLFWKALALWHSSRRNQLTWFIILLFVNTLGILEIVYLVMGKEYDLKSKELLVAIKDFETKYLKKYYKTKIKA